MPHFKKQPKGRMPHIEKVTLGRRFPSGRKGPGGDGLPQREDGLVDMVPQLNRIVQPAEPGEFSLCLGRQSLRFQKALIGTARFVIFFDFFETRFYLAFKFHGRHEEIEKGDQGEIGLGKEGLEGCPLKTVIADVLADDGAVFLFNKAIVVFLFVLLSGRTG
jgi:hypothetical protein